MADSALVLRFEALLLTIANEEIKKSLSSLFASPPVEAVRRAVPACASCDEARRLLFFPQQEDGAAYAAMIAQRGSPSPARPALGLLYMLHHATEVARGLVLAGGLEALAARLLEPDLHVRAHAVETLLRITADEGMRWYESPSKGSADAELQRALLALGARTGGQFLAGLLGNRSDSYPGGEKACLDLFAFWLGWARQQHSDMRRLSLSSTIVQQLSDWVLRARGRADDEEQQLAAQLFEDFSRSPSCGGDDVGNLALRCAGDEDDDDDEPVAVVELDEKGGFDLDDAPVPPPPPARAAPVKSPCRREKTARELGNAAFACGDFASALSQYAAALRELGVDGSDVDWAALSQSAASGASAAAVLLCNRATCFLKMHEQLERGDATRNERAALLSRCERECALALVADARNAKAHYRMAQVLAAVIADTDAADDARGPVQSSDTTVSASRAPRTWEAISACEKALAALGRDDCAARAPVEELLLTLARQAGSCASADASTQRAGKAARLASRLLSNTVHEMMRSDAPAQRTAPKAHTHARSDADASEASQQPGEERAPDDGATTDATTTTTALVTTTTTSSSSTRACDDDDDDSDRDQPPAAHHDGPDSDDDEALEQLKAEKRRNAKILRKTRQAERAHNNTDTAKPKKRAATKADKVARILARSLAA